MQLCVVPVLYSVLHLEHQTRLFDDLELTGA